MATLTRVIFFLFFILSNPALAKSEPTSSGSAADSAAAPVSIETVNAERSIVTSSQALNDQQRNESLAKLDEAAKSLQETRLHRSIHADLQSEIEQASGLIKQLEKKSLGIESIQLSVIATYSTEKLKSLLDSSRSELELARTGLERQEKLLSEYIAFAKSGGAEIADINERLNRLNFSPTNGEKNSSTADRLYLTAKTQQLAARLSVLRIKQKNLDVLTELATARRDFFTREVSILQRNLDQIHTALQAIAKRELESMLLDPDKKATDLPPAFKPLQNKINALIKEQNELLADSSIKSRRLDTVKRLLDELQADQKRVQQVIDLTSDSEQISTLLQKRRALIPSVSSLTDEVIAYQSTMSESVLRQLQLDEMLRETSIDSLITGQPKDQTDNTQLTQAAKQLIDNHRNISQELIKKYNTYIAQLSSLDATTRQLLGVAQEYRAYIDDRLLWMPSTGLIQIFQPISLLHGLVWLINPNNIELLLKDSLLTIKSHKLLVFVLFLAVISLFLVRRRALQALEQSASTTLKIKTDSFTTTSIALISTALLTLPIPILLIGSGLLLARLANASEYSQGISAGLQGSGMILLLLYFVFELTRKNGLASSHLSWHNSLSDGLHKQLGWIIPTVTPLAFLFSINATGLSSSFVQLSSYRKISESGVYTLGQIAFIALMIIMLIGLYRVWNKDSALMKKISSVSNKASWPQYHALWFTPLMLIPLGFTIASILGYDYTTTFLIAKAINTLWIILAFILLKDILLRSLYVTQRRLKLEEMIKIRQELKKQKAQDKEPAVVTDGIILDDEKIPYGELSHQVDQLIRTVFITSILIGLWWVWKEIIPALSIFNTVDLPMTTSTIVDGVSKEIPLTLGDLLVGLIMGSLTLLAARSVPGLMEFTLLSRLPIAQASRYAVTTLTQYFVAVIGITISFNALGLQWSNIQWLVAALSVGLGFGLQEIVANFVSGIILLFEQPIRVGDVVTVDGTTGTVSRIRIRATTIVNWEKQELIVPNKTFITGQLVNWTLSDKVNRVIIPVGVAYGSDTVKAMQLLAEAAAELPAILLDPPPRITFEEFGDNSLNLKLRVYLNDIDLRLPTITALHQSISDKFKAADIVIAYPQRDLHLDTSSPLELVLRDNRIDKPEPVKAESIRPDTQPDAQSVTPLKD